MAAAALVFAVVVAISIALMAQGLNGAAAVATVLSLFAFLPSLIDWARNRRKAQDPVAAARAELGEWLRTITDGKGLTRQDLRNAMRGWTAEQVDAYLDGTRQPEWAFIDVFLTVVTADDRWYRELLERHIRPVWNAAAAAAGRNRKTRADADHSAARESAARANRDWLAALKDLIGARQVLRRVEISIRQHEVLAAGLAEMLARLSQAIVSLTAERGTQPRQQPEGSADRPGSAQQRLNEAERLQAATRRRLEVSEGQRRDAQRLKERATGQAEQAERRLALLDSQLRTPIPQNAGPPEITDGAVDVLMGTTDREAAEQVLRRVDEVLRDESENLGHLDRDLAGHPTADPPPRTVRPRLVIGAVVAVIVGLLLANNLGRATNHGPVATGAGSPTATSSVSPPATSPASQAATSSGSHDFTLPPATCTDAAWFSFDLERTTTNADQAEATYCSEGSAPLLTVLRYNGLVQSDVGKQECYDATVGPDSLMRIPLRQGQLFCVSTLEGVALVEITQTPTQGGPLHFSETYWPGAIYSTTPPTAQLEPAPQG